VLAAERQARIVQRIERTDHVSVDELAAWLETSAATIRRDLSGLEQAGLLQRVHGGAAALAKRAEAPVPTPEDEALASAVYGRLAGGDAVILEGRLVMPIVARKLVAKPMRTIVVTNQLDIAETLLRGSGIDVIMLGGKLHPAGYTLPQPLGASDLKFLVANKAFIEVEGVHGAAGMTTTAVEEARFKHDLLQHALRKTVVAPASRWGLVFSHRIAQVSEVDSWITTRLDSEQRDAAATLTCEIVESAA
jgi:DeoR/GlpR family transcriptional regulator of sugar metabolism